jgi:aminoglycoside N3'-acetyltransferase
MDISDRQAFLDEVARWKTRWNMVDEQKPQTLLETLNVTNQDLIGPKSTLIIPTPLLITSSTLRFLVLWMCNNDKFDNLSSPIVALRQFFTIIER